MRACFLDFDGPLHPVSMIADCRNATAPELPHLIRSRQLFRWLPLLARELEQRDDVAIVVHSSWRTKADNTMLRRVLGSLAPRLIGVTTADLSRYEGIVDYAARLGIADYCIVDDDESSFPEGLPQLILTDPELGLGDPATRAALAHWLDETTPSERPTERMMSGA